MYSSGTVWLMVSNDDPPPDERGQSCWFSDVTHEAVHELNAYVRPASGDAPVPSLPHLVKLSPASSVCPSFSIVLLLNPRCQRLSLIQLVNRLTTIAVATQTSICVLSFPFFFFRSNTNCTLHDEIKMQPYVCVCIFLSFVAMVTAGCCPGWRVWRSNKSQRRSLCCQSREDWTQTRSVQTPSLLSLLSLLSRPSNGESLRTKTSRWSRSWATTEYN